MSTHKTRVSPESAGRFVIVLVFAIQCTGSVSVCQGPRLPPGHHQAIGCVHLSSSAQEAGIRSDHHFCETIQRSDLSMSPPFNNHVVHSNRVGSDLHTHRRSSAGPHHGCTEGSFPLLRQPQRVQADRCEHDRGHASTCECECATRQPMRASATCPCLQNACVRPRGVAPHCVCHLLLSPLAR